MNKNNIVVKRFHGLGDIILLLPVLENAVNCGKHVLIATHDEWCDVFSHLLPGFTWTSNTPSSAIDLDVLTSRIKPTEHRTDEFGRLLNIQGPFNAPHIAVPQSWKDQYRQLADCIIFAPEAEHRARSAPDEFALAVANSFPKDKLVLVGKDTSPALPCSIDYRGNMSVKELISALASCHAVICMDSGVLHIAGAVGTPTVAVFGGVDPVFRIRPFQKVIALQADMPCCPCNKNETCGEAYDCLRAANAQDIIRAVKDVLLTDHLVIKRFCRN